VVRISIRDENAAVRFVEVEMTTHDFAMAVTGLSGVQCKGEVKRLDVVGKTRRIEKRSAVCPIKTYDEEILSGWLEANCEEEGWELQKHLGSQNSVISVAGGTKLNYSMFRYE
jgi:hypothetical protein